VELYHLKSKGFDSNKTKEEMATIISYYRVDPSQYRENWYIIGVLRKHKYMNNVINILFL